VPNLAQVPVLAGCMYHQCRCTKPTVDGRGVLQIVVPEKLAGITLLPANNRVARELALVIHTDVLVFSRLIAKEISVEKVIPLIKKGYKIELPSRIKDYAYSQELLQSIPFQGSDKVFEFYKELFKIRL
jgi:hypothetical protein